LLFVFFTSYLIIVGIKRYCDLYHIYYEGAWPDHHCKVPHGSLRNETIPKTDDGDYEKCLIYVANNTNKTTECNEWQYLDDDVGYTIVSQVKCAPRCCPCVNANLKSAISGLLKNDQAFVLFMVCGLTDWKVLLASFPSLPVPVFLPFSSFPSISIFLLLSFFLAQDGKPPYLNVSALSVELG